MPAATIAEPSRRATRARRARGGGLVVAVCLVAAGCADAETPVTRADYLSDLQAICASTTAELDALPEPPELISVADFATSAADSLEREAQRVDRLVVPGPDDPDGDDPATDPDGDHRAFVRNTLDQAAAWRAIAQADRAGSDDISDSTELIAQLVGGRNELAEQMNAPECVRGGL
jgi:hypothetical protein